MFKNICIIAAKNNDFAYQKKVILVSPTNFIACIRIVAELWRYQRQNKNFMSFSSDLA